MSEQQIDPEVQWLIDAVECGFLAKVYQYARSISARLAARPDDAGRVMVDDELIAKMVTAMSHHDTGFRNNQGYTNMARAALSVVIADRTDDAGRVTVDRDYAEWIAKQCRECGGTGVIDSDNGVGGYVGCVCPMCGELHRALEAER